MSRTSRCVSAAMAALSLGFLAGCNATAPESADTELTLEEAVEPAADVAVASAAVAEWPEPVVVSDDPPRELPFTRTMTDRYRDLLNRELADEMAGGRGATTPTVAEFDLNGDGTTELFVMIKAPAWCGSGEVCNIWIFEQTSDGWRPLSDGRDAGSCLSVLPTATNGYRDVRLHGQCAIEMCTFDIRWDGTVYVWDGNRECDEIPGLHRPDR